VDGSLYVDTLAFFSLSNMPPSVMVHWQGRISNRHHTAHTKHGCSSSLEFFLDREFDGASPGVANVLGIPTYAADKIVFYSHLDGIPLYTQGE
jgi:hypothetical protein